MGRDSGLAFRSGSCRKFGFARRFPRRPGITLGQTRRRSGSSASTNFSIYSRRLEICMIVLNTAGSRLPFIVLGIMVTDQLQGVSFKVYDDRTVPQRCFQP